MKNRHIAYNETLKYIEEEEKAGRIFVIRPQEDLVISRLEKDECKLRALYDEGYGEAASMYDEMIAYLNK